MIFSVILLFTVFYNTSASPISPVGVQNSAKLAAISERNGNRTTMISNFYISTPGVGTHKFHTLQKKNWNDARTTCLNEGAHLAVINSAAEEALIVKYMVDKKINDELWIGIHEQFKKDEWISVKDQRLDAIGYVHWRQGEPNNHQNSSEHCLTITQLGMNDLNCGREMFFVCEI